MSFEIKTIWEIFWDVKIWWTPPRERAEYFWWWIPWVSIKDMWKWKYVSETNESLSESWVQNSNVKLIKKGSLLFSFKLTVWRMCFAWTDLYTNEAIAAFEPNPEIMLEYLYYILPVATKQVKRTNNFWAPLLNKDQIKKLRIPLPPLETQKAIVAKLDQIFAELDQTKSEIQNNLNSTDELWKSALNQAFQGDWEMKKLGEVCENIFAWWDKPKNFSEEQTEKYKVPVYANWVDKDWLVWFTDVARVNDICLTVSWRWTIWFPVIRETPFVPIVRLIVAIPNKNLNIKYLWYSVLWIDFNDTWVAIPQLTVPRFKEHMIPVPPLSEQEKIVEHLDQVSKEVKALKSQYQSQLDNLEELKKSVLDKAFKWEMG